LENYFKEINSNIIFYGHTHVKSFLKKTKEYYNPGSAGCSKNNETSFIILTIRNNKIKVENKTLEYNKKALLDEYNNKKVPGREEIIRIFY
jgi:predicted phosphodiesterase